MGWDDGSLSEDTELSVRQAKRGHVVRYAPEVGSWQENPESLGQLSSQRTRWFRGCMEVSLRYGRLITQLKSRSVDVEVTLVGPHILALCFMGYLATLYTVLVPIRLDPFFTVMTQFTSLMSLIPLCVIGMALVYVTKPHRVTNILWLPFIHAYWTPQTFMALYALVQIVLRRPKVWAKTVKTGKKFSHFRMGNQALRRSPLFLPSIRRRRYRGLCCWLLGMWIGWMGGVAHWMRLVITCVLKIMLSPSLDVNGIC